ncbi:MAG: HAMP domain-containing protein [Chloroflexi bacterium]|nr:HAMP domain-containing protein [Chloroflexota bacterium]
MILIILTGLDMRNAAIEQARRETQQVVHLITLQQQNVVEAAHTLLQALERFGNTFLYSPERCNAFLAEIGQSNPSYTGFSAVAPNGDLICSSLPLTTTVNVSDRAYFQRAMQSRQFSVGDYQIGRLSGQAILIFALPLLDEANEVDGLLIAGLDLAWFNRLTAQIELPPQSTITVFDRNGVILARQPDGERWIGQALPYESLVRTVLEEKQGSVEMLGLDDVRRLYSFAELPGADRGVHTTVGVPAAVAYAESNRILTRNLGWLGVVFGLALLLAWVGSDHLILHQVTRLLEVTERLAGGDLSARADLSQTSGELSQLAQSFNQMAAALEAQEQERRRAEVALRKSEERYRMLFATMLDGYALHELIYAETGKPSDYRFLEVNAAFETMTGLSAQNIIGRTVRQVLPGIESTWIEMYGNVVLSGQPIQFENYAEPLDRYFEVIAFCPSPGQFATIFHDVTRSKQAEEALKEYAARLEQSNRELQDFAYITSHDLQEPLRKIRAFGDRLNARYQKELDAQGQDYLARMTDAATRMSRLIDDLLTYSRVNTRSLPFVPTDLGRVARAVADDLEIRIQQTGGRVEIEELPTLEADPRQMGQLLQNLIGNSLKFHRADAPPVVKVYARRLDRSPGLMAGEDSWQILVEDNSIGFEERHMERIFQPFERLHSRDEYEGSGIGLAICRKIVERHGGSITAASRPGEGTTFIITLPASQPNVSDSATL